MRVHKYEGKFNLFIDRSSNRLLFMRWFCPMIHEANNLDSAKQSVKGSKPTADLFQTMVPSPYNRAAMLSRLISVFITA